MSNDEPVYLLSLDGGGIRGISELVILDEIMKRLQALAGWKDLPKPRDHFHLIGGTSTGGLIAIMLGRMGMTTKEAIECYDDTAKNIFRSSNRRPNLTFREKAVEESIQNYVARMKLPTTVMIDEDRRGKGLAFVCSTPSRNFDRPYLFRTYRGKDNHAHNVEIWEAARATTAAPTFFAPVSIKVEAERASYVDGALVANNPVKLVLKEAEDQFGSGRKLGFLLSLGTGLKETDKGANVGGDPKEALDRAPAPGSKLPRTESGAFFSRGTIRLAKHAKMVLTNPEIANRELAERFRSIPYAYFRLNLDKGASDIKLHKYKMMNKLKEATEAYLQNVQVSADIDKIADILYTKGGANLPLEAACRATSVEASRHAVVEEVKFRSIASHLFTGRADILERMDRHFCERPRGSSPRRLLRIWGMGGVGKTQIALKFRDLCQSQSRFDRIFWINAASTGSIYESFRIVTDKIFDEEGEHSKPEITRVLEWLSRKRKEEWLLIFDNNDTVDVSKYIPDGDAGNILFTSRQKEISPILKGDQVLAVDSMNEADAMALLLRASEKHKDILSMDDECHAKEILKELGHLPLAIDQAGSYIEVQKCALKDYLDAFRSRQAVILKMLKNSSLYPGAFEDNPAVYGTFDLSYEALERRSKKDDDKGRAALNAIRILNIFCFYHNENLSDEIISRAATNPHLDLEALGDLGETERLAPMALFELKADKTWESSNYYEGIMLLRSYSLLKKSAVNDEWHSMHVLVHSWARDRMDNDRMDKEVLRIQRFTARSIIFDCFHLFKFEDERFLAQLLPHVRSLVNRGGSEHGSWVKRTMQDTKYGRLLREVGMWREALSVFEDIVQERRTSLEFGDELVIRGLWDLAKMYNYCCELENAHMLFDECLNMWTSCPNVAWALRNWPKLAIDFADVLNQRGFHGSAQQMLREVVDEEKKMDRKGAKYRSALAALATTYQLAGLIDDAYEIEAVVFDLCLNDDKIGAGHRATMGAISNLAMLRSAKGEHEKADEMWRHVLEVDEKFRGKEHPITLQSKRNVAIGCINLKQFEEAERLLREALEASERVLWRTHLETLTTMEHLADVLHRMGKEAEALELQEECLAGRRDILGDKHKKTVKAKTALETMKKQGQLLMVEQVQWQAEDTMLSGDSNYALQGYNDRYLH